MSGCKASIQSGKPCGKQQLQDSSFCAEHQSRPAAIKERERRSLTNVVDAVSTFNPQFVEDNEPMGAQVEKKQENKPVHIKNIYEKTMDVMDRALEWEEITWQGVMNLGPSEWRYVDKAGAEQLRSEVSLNERAQDRTIRAVTAIAKLDIDAQTVNVNRMMRDLIKNVVVKAMGQAGLMPEQINQVRILIAKEFENIARESTTKEG